MQRGTRGRLQPPIDDIETFWSPMEKAQASRMLTRSFVGGPETVRRSLEAFIAETDADELIVASAIYDHTARVRSYEILADVRQAMERARSGSLKLLRPGVDERQANASKMTTVPRCKRGFAGTRDTGYLHVANFDRASSLALFRRDDPRRLSRSKVKGKHSAVEQFDQSR